MNISSKNLCLVLAGVLLAFSGCTKKPVRPIPPSTVVAPATTVAPSDVVVPTDAAPGTGLTNRDPNIQEDADSIRGLLKPVYFDFDQAGIKADERPKISDAAKYLKDNPGTRLLLEGHCDWRGTAEYNLGLGDRRASAVKQFLATLGVKEEQMETLSKGSVGATEKGPEDVMSKERRVEIVILKKK
jgi:peptidoglycan-associated lipoprotein